MNVAYDSATTRARLIAIGDIHGCARALEAVLGAIGPTADDCFVPLGDYVDRGPDSRRAIDLLIELGETSHVAPLVGNHEEMMQAVIVGRQEPQRWLRFGGLATLESYGFSGDFRAFPDSHVAFLQSCRDHYEASDCFFVHASYDPRSPLGSQDRILTRWRTLRDAVPAPHVSGKRAIVGHTPDLGGEIFDVGHLTCIDTYCYGGRWLTALDVVSGTLWQASARGELRELHACDASTSICDA